MPGRSYNSADYRYGVGGHEKDNEVSGEGNHLDFGGFGLDSRLGRRWNVEPLIKKYPSLSSYVVFANSPIIFVDPDGRDVILTSHICQSNCDKNNLNDVQTWNDISGLTNQNTISAMKAFLSTPEGYNFVSQYAKAGTDILGFAFTKDGALSNHDLVFNDVVGYKASGALAETTYSLARDKVIIYKNQTFITKSSIYTDIGWPNSVSANMLTDKVLSDNPQSEAYETARVVTSITLWDANTQSVADKALTIGHEAYLHAEKKSSVALMKLQKGDYSGAATLLNRNTGPHGDVDHSNYADNPGLFMTFEKYSKSLGNTSVGKQKASNAVKAHDTKYNVRRQ